MFGYNILKTLLVRTNNKFKLINSATILDTITALFSQSRHSVESGNVHLRHLTDWQTAVKMYVFAQPTHRSLPCGSRPHSRRMSNAAGPVLILLWLKQPLQQEIHLTAPGCCPLSQQAFCSSLSPPHLSLSSQTHCTSTPPSLHSWEHTHACILSFC